MAVELGLERSVAVVTGALGRLGPIWVRTLAGAGAAVAGLDLHEDGADELREQVAATRGSFSLLEADVTDRVSLERARAQVEAELGVPSVLVNNAGIDQPPDPDAPTQSVEDVSAEAFIEVLDVNLVGTFRATQVFGSAMANAGRGSIVNVGSLYASVAPDPGFYDHLPLDPPFLKPAGYGASKAAVINLTRYFARLWGPRGVRVNAISPGGVRTDQDAEFLRKYCARVPLGRMAEPSDLAGPLLFLASDASRYVSGHELRVDGGFTA